MPVAWEPCALPPFSYEQTSKEPERYVVQGKDESGGDVHVATVRSTKAAWHLMQVLNGEAHDREEARVRHEAEEKALALWKERMGEGDPRPDVGCCGQHYVPLLVWAMEEIDKLKACPARGLTRAERTTLDAGKPIEVIRMIQKRTGLTVAEAKVFLDKYRNEPRSYFDR